MAPRSQSNGTDTDAVRLALDLVDRTIAAQLAPVVGKLEKLELKVADLAREVHDGNSRSITAPGKMLVIPINPWSISAAIVLAAMLLLALTGQAAHIPAIVSKMPPAPVAPTGE
jgi:hypothetical protein